jgi:hypothetical protein
MFLFNSRYEDASDELLDVAAAALRMAKGRGSPKEVDDALRLFRRKFASN